MYAGIHFPSPVFSSMSKQSFGPKTFGWGMVENNVIDGGNTGYSIGKEIEMWKTPPAQGDPEGPLKFPCHSYMLSGKGLAETPTRGS